MTHDIDRLRSYLRRVTGELQKTRDELREERHKAQEPIAIIGMSCRYPGGVDSPEALWRLVARGGDAISGFPTDRGWQLDALFDPDPDARGKSVTDQGGFLHGSTLFDPAFFGISPREALSMDPQQRLLLETSWEAIERAGIHPASLARSPTGVFVGLCATEYQRLLPSPDIADDGYGIIGAAPSVASGRISYFLGLEGPALSIDTACSSSLVAIHTAIQSLRRGECNLALAGGSTVFATTESFVLFSRMRMAAPDGRSRAFSKDANGVGWSEGAGMLLLERLSDAKRLGHPILALLHGSAVNQDGRSQGLTAPNGPSQERVIASALADAALHPRDIDAVEAHGTGTVLGDPIEAQALIHAYGQDRDPDRPLWLGSLKSNIGHTQAAAGVAGIIKMVMALRHQTLPPTLHVQAPSPHVDWDGAPIRLLRESTPWTIDGGVEGQAGQAPHGRPRRAAVSSFGISGTNAHVILGEPPREERQARDDPHAVDDGPIARADGQDVTSRPLPFLLHARTPEALRAQAQQLHHHVREHPALPLPDLAASLATRRSPFEHRAAIVASDRSRLLLALSALSDPSTFFALDSGHAPPGLLRDEVPRGDSGDSPNSSNSSDSPNSRNFSHLAFVFSGQGSQWPGMGRALYDAFPLFRDVFDSALAHLQPHLQPALDQPLRDVVFAPSDSPRASLLHQTGYAQPALFALQLALFRLLESFGIEPHALIGHSLGEITAAHIAGVFSLSDAAKLVALRARFMQSLPSDGAMFALQVAEDELLSLLAPHSEHLAIAALNGPMAAVISGDADAAEAVAHELQSRGRKATRLRVSHAFHSHRMDPILADFRRAISDLSFHPPRILIVSNVTGKSIDPDLLCQPDYWVRHLREPVRFLDGIRQLEALGTRTFLELGPEGGLAAIAQTCLSPDNADDARFLACLRKDEQDATAFITVLASLHARGYPVDWGRFFGPLPAAHLDLPTYPFQRQRYWLTPRQQPRSVDGESHPLLGTVTHVADSGALVCQSRLALEQLPWLADHVVFGHPVLPATVFLDMALAAAARLGVHSLDELTLEAPLVLPTDGALLLQLVVDPPRDDGRQHLRILAKPQASRDAPWTRHASGLLPSAAHAPPSLTAAPSDAWSTTDAWPPPDAEPLDRDDLYPRLARIGIAYGPSFQGLQRVWRQGDTLFAEASLPLHDDTSEYLIHPALFDAALHALAFAGLGHSVHLPFAFNAFSLHAPPQSRGLRLRIRSTAPDSFAIDLRDDRGAPVATLQALSVRPATHEQLQAALPTPRLPSYRIHWEPLPGSPTLSPAPHAPLRGCILGDANDAFTAALADSLSFPCFADASALLAAIDAGHPLPDSVLLPIDSSGPTHDDLLQTTHRLAHRALDWLQIWQRNATLAACPLTLVTRHAVACSPTDPVLQLAAAPLWGMLRSAQRELPDLHLRLLDLDLDHALPDHALPDPGLLLRALTAALPQAALRAGQTLIPQLVRADTPKLPDAPKPHAVRSPSWTTGTVLITGGTGGLGALLARHLARHHAVRHLVLASRSGPLAQGALALRHDLQALGAHVTLAACDVSQRPALAELLESLPATPPLTAIIHTAAVLQDALIDTLDHKHLNAVFAPKLDAAVHLDQLTRHLPIQAFILFSSLAGIIGSPGQANYSAANAFLDALAQRRRAQGLPGLSLAWGQWGGAGIAARLSEPDKDRLRRHGIPPLDPAQALALFDDAIAQDEALLVPANIDPSALLRQPGIPSSLLERLEPKARIAASRQEASLQHRIAALPQEERTQALLDVVQHQAGLVLGLTPNAVPPERPLMELGLDSIMAIELRNRLAALAAIRLPSTLLFDHPTPNALVQLLVQQLDSAANDGSSRSKSSRSAPARPRLHGIERIGAHEPIAIVGMSCRYPGGVDSPEALWHLVARGGDGISGFPSDRGWQLDSLFDPDPDARGKSITDQGGFLHDSALFDPAFFGISPREALSMDPQQRLLLETSWEAIERAGIRPASLAQSPTGVFLGIMHNDYAGRFIQSNDALDGSVVIGSAASVASGRISYILGLEGPALSIDTACSSSLVAIHTAIQSLRRGECNLALAGGVSVMATPAIFVEFSRQRVLATDGRCKPFSKGANGIGWSEGVGMLLLERLSDAKRLRHPVLALLHGSAVNQDGRSQGLTAPNGPSQERVIASALADAALNPRDIDAVEAHGTGTVLGDPIEAQALIHAYGQDRDPARPLWLGSIKSNIGHTQAAAGVAGVIKMVMALRHQTLPPTLHVQAPSPHVDWDAAPIRLLREPTPWVLNDSVEGPAGQAPHGRPRRAAVSSFGISGTNAHVILGEPPPEDRQALDDRQARDNGLARDNAQALENGQTARANRTGHEAANPPWPFLLHARTPEALRARAKQLHHHLLEHPALPLPDLAATLATRRSFFEHRAAIIASDRSQLLSALDALDAGKPHPAAVVHSVIPAGKTVFVFPGQGAQWHGMALSLYQSSAPFRLHLDACERAFAPHVDWSLLHVLRRDENAPDLHRLDVVQAVNFAVMTALAALWRDLGVEPDAVIGHSQGEIAAAYVAGALSLDDASAVVIRRGRLVRTLQGGGGMIAIPLGEAEVCERIRPWQERLGISAVNSPASTVVSGEVAALEELMANLVRDGVAAQRTDAQYASHGPSVEPLREALLRELGSIRPRPGTIPLFSTTHVARLDGRELDADYWYRNLRHAVRFADATSALLDHGHRFFVEVSTHPTLALPIAETAEAAGIPIALVGSLWRNKGSLARLLLSLGELHARGCPVDWARFFGPLPAAHLDLPTYPFQRQRYWLSTPPQPRSADGDPHPLLGTVMHIADSGALVCQSRLTLDQLPWLADHVVFGHTILPAAAFLDMTLAAASRLGIHALDELTLEAPLLVPSDGAVLLQLVIDPPGDDGRQHLRILAKPQAPRDAPWTRHASGVLPSAAHAQPSLIPAPSDAWSATDAWPPPDAEPLDRDDIYPRFARIGVEYGPSFQGLQRVWRQGDTLFAEASLPLHDDTSEYLIHPALFDAALHALAFAGLDLSVHLPFAFNAFSLHAPPQSHGLRLRIRPAAPDSFAIDFRDDRAAPVATLQSLSVRPATPEQLQAALPTPRLPSYRIHWEPLTLPPTLSPTPHTSLRGCILGDASAPFTASLAGSLSFPCFADPSALLTAIDAGHPLPDSVLLPIDPSEPSDDDLLQTTHRLAHRTLDWLQTWQRNTTLAACPLTLITRHAVACAPTDPVLQLAAAPLWGMLRSAQRELPDLHLRLLDLDFDFDHDPTLLQRTLTAAPPQAALRAGQTLIPQLVHADRPKPHTVRSPSWTTGTVLITGGTGGLGALLARHLARHHAVRHLVLASRSGPLAQGALALRHDLQALGAHVTLAACDVSQRPALAELLESLPATPPLTAIIHTAAVLQDALIDTLDHKHLNAVFAPKLDAAVHLDQLTRHLPIQAFILFSSLAGIIGAPGQANYSAANAFLDALAQRRRAQGLPALSLAWGQWGDVGRAAQLSEIHLDRLRRLGVPPMDPAQALALFDDAIAQDEALLLPANIDPSALLRQPGMPSSLLERLQPKARRSRPRRDVSRHEQLAALPRQERTQALLDLIKQEAATALGMTTVDAFDPATPFSELGLDSLIALQVRNRLNLLTGLTLPQRLLFDHPTLSALAEKLAEALNPTA